MLHFFRNIRRRLLESGKVQNYLLYAIGEILLVVIGILIALQVNNWNEERKQEQRFRVTLEQIYTSIKEDSELMYYLQQNQQKQIDWIDQILANSSSFNPKRLIYILFYLDTKPRLYSSETEFLLSSLEFNPNNVAQNELAKQISSYVKGEMWDFNTELWLQKESLSSFLEAASIPRYPISFGYSALSNFENADTTFFSDADVVAVQSLLKTRKFINTLIYLKEVKQLINAASFQNHIDDSRSILQAIRAYYPGVRLRFDDVGILGTAFDSGYNQSIPMTLTNPQEGIWEIHTSLKQGTVKFRTRDSWNQNWGGDTFPKGRTKMYGADIRVEEGNYHIVLNLTQNTYEFIKKEQ